MAAPRLDPAGTARRITLHLPPDLLVWVEAMAASRRSTVSVVLRDALSSYALAHPCAP